MAKKVTVSQHIERIWDIEGFPNYFFGHDKQLYRYDARGQVKTNKRVVIGSTQVTYSNENSIACPNGVHYCVGTELQTIQRNLKRPDFVSRSCITTSYIQMPQTTPN